MIEEMKLSKKDLQECLNNLEGEKFLDAFCVIDWVNKTEKENKDLQQRIVNAIEYIENNKIANLVDEDFQHTRIERKAETILLDILKGKEVK